MGTRMSMGMRSQTVPQVKRQLDRDRLARIVDAEDVSEVPFDTLVGWFQAEVQESLPDGVAQTDPRNGDRVIFCPARGRRPHDYDDYDAEVERHQPHPADAATREAACIICQGRTTRVVDVAALSTGFTFINKNLYPIVHPGPHRPAETPTSAGRPVVGLHFVQWTSSQHDRDWHNMPPADCTIVMERLAALEEYLLTNSMPLFTLPILLDEHEQRYVSIIKNYGRLVGGSLAHPHQQIWVSNIAPRRVAEHRRFQAEHGETFSAYLLRENPAELLVRDYGPAVLIVPYFMRRPYDMMLLMKDSRKAYLHELNAEEISAAAMGWHDALRAIRAIMPRIGRELAYNVVTHNGAGAGLYFEFLPYVQEIGGAEHLGLFICQGEPYSAARQIRSCLTTG